MTELDGINARVTCAQLGDFGNVVGRGGGLAPLVNQVWHRVKTDATFLVWCRQDSVRHIETYRSCGRCLCCPALRVHHRDRIARAERPQLYTTLEVPQFHNTVTESRGQKLTLLAEFYASTDRDLFALVGIEHVQLLASGCLTEDDLTVICATGRDHVVVRPGDWVYSGALNVMVNHCLRSNFVLFSCHLEIV